MNTAILLALLGLVALTSANSLSFRASPKVAVEDITDELSFQCKSPSSVNQKVYVAVLLHLDKTDENDTKTNVATQTSTRLELGSTADNRTSATANLQDSQDDEGSFLDVTIEKPVVEDSGIYECRFIYVDLDYKVHQFVSEVNISVKAVTPPNYVPEVAGSLEDKDCSCDQVWDEIENIKATLVVENEKLREQVGSYNETCRVSFSAQFSDKVNTNVASQELRFDHVTNNKGNAYSADTGAFTAPCAGQYYFSLTLRSHQSMDSGYVMGIIMVDESPVARTSVFIDAPFDNYQSASNSAVVSLKPGQKVKVLSKTTSSGVYLKEDYSIFNGYFLFP